MVNRTWLVAATLSAVGVMGCDSPAPSEETPAAAGPQTVTFFVKDMGTRLKLL